MEYKEEAENAEEEIVELGDGELEGVAGGIEVPPPSTPPAPIGEGHLGEQQTNCTLFSTRNV